MLAIMCKTQCDNGEKYHQKFGQLALIPRDIFKKLLKDFYLEVVGRGPSFLKSLDFFLKTLC